MPLGDREPDAALVALRPAITVAALALESAIGIDGCGIGTRSKFRSAFPVAVGDGDALAPLVFHRVAAAALAFKRAVGIDRDGMGLRTELATADRMAFGHGRRAADAGTVHVVPDEPVLALALELAVVQGTVRERRCTEFGAALPVAFISLVADGGDGLVD